MILSGMPKIVLVPLGDVAASEIESAEAALAREVGARVRRGSHALVSTPAINRKRGQVRAEVLLFQLRRARDAAQNELALGVCDADIYAHGLSFVFGLASQRAGAAVVSVARLRDEDPARAQRRIETEAVHEAGHLLGLPHCETSGCAMRFSNSLAEADEKGPGLCERCRDLLQGA
jgi:archaemetzincin